MPIETPMRILKIDTCPTLSGSSSITYHIGCDDSGEIHFRIWATTGGGTFSKEWISLQALQQHLKKQPKEITSISLYPAFRGKSVNTPSYLLSALKHEGLVQTMKGKRRHQELCDQKPFMESMAALIASDIDLDPEAKPKKRATRPSPKKTSAPKTRRSR